MADFPSTTIIDDFNRGSLGSDWNADIGTPSISDNKLVFGTVGLNTARYLKATYGGAVEFWVTVGGLNADDTNNAYLDYDASTVDQHRYFIYAAGLTTTGTDYIALYKYNGANVLLDSSGGLVWDSRASIKIGVRHYANGDFEVYLDRGSGWEVVASGNDSEELKVGSVKLRAYDADAIPATTFDDFGGGDYVGCTVETVVNTNTVVDVVTVTVMEE